MTQRIQINAGAKQGAFRWFIVGGGAKVAVPHVKAIMLNGDFLVGFSSSNPDVRSGDATKIAFNMGGRGELFETDGLLIVDDYRKAIGSDEIDGVIVCAPTNFHAAIGMHIARRRKHCFMEKPVANSHVDGRQLLDAFRESSSRLAVGHILPFFPAFGYLIDQVQLRGIAKVKNLATKRWVPWADTEDQKGIAGGGGYAQDLGVHDVHLLLRACGHPSHVRVMERSARYGYFQRMQVQLTFKDAPGQFSCDVGANQEVEGFHHSYRVEFLDGDVLAYENDLLTLNGEPVKLQEKIIPDEVFADEQQVAVDYFRGQRQSAGHLSPYLAVQTLQVLEAAAEAADSGEEIEL
jgi:predicted dehydrogenase